MTPSHAWIRFNPFDVFSIHADGRDKKMIKGTGASLHNDQAGRELPSNKTMDSGRICRAVDSLDSTDTAPLSSNIIRKKLHFFILSIAMEGKKKTLVLVFPPPHTYTFLLAHTRIPPRHSVGPRSPV